MEQLTQEEIEQLSRLKELHLIKTKWEAKGSGLTKSETMEYNELCKKLSKTLPFNV